MGVFDAFIIAVVLAIACALVVAVWEAWIQRHTRGVLSIAGFLFLYPMWRMFDTPALTGVRLYRIHVTVLIAALFAYCVYRAPEWLGRAVPATLKQSPSAGSTGIKVRKTKGLKAFDNTYIGPGTAMDIEESENVELGRNVAINPEEENPKP